MRRSYKFLAILCLVSMLFIGSYVAYGDIRGTVHDSDNQPVYNASVRVFSGARGLDQTYTGETGGFEFLLSEGNYTILVYGGGSYLPVVIKVGGSLLGTEVTLSPGAMVEFSGDMQFVDTESLPLQTVITVLDQQGEPIADSGYRLVYGTEVRGPQEVSELSSNQIMIPVGQPVSISLNSSYLMGSFLESRSILLNVNSMPLGGVYNVDLREYTIPLNREFTDESLNQLESRLDELDGYGFYLTSQETALASGNSLVEQSESFYAEESYAESYEALKRGYLVFENTSRELNQMYRDASVSIFILIGFLAVSSLVLGYLMTEDVTTQVIVDILVYGFALVFFYYTYPGSRIITIQTFAFASAGILAGFLALGRILPSFFRVGSRDGRVHTRNLVMPIFSLAKRSLRRRRLRFLLTLVSLTLLVTSFVTLTSFSQGYGVVSGWSQPRTGWDGVFIRDTGWTEYDPTFLQFDEIELSWLLSQPELSEVYFKAENMPFKYPFEVVNGQPVYGVIGGDDNEFKVTGLESVLVAGSLPVDGVMVSEGFLDETGLELGDQLSIISTSLPLEGVFDAVAMSSLRDLDGSQYLSKKWVNTNPGEREPIWVLQDVEPVEQVFTSLETAVKFSLVDVQRVGFTVSSDYVEDGFAGRLALERGYKSYSSTREGFTVFRLGNYFEGKGMSLVIPWVIVVLNVVVTMLNSLFERRKEIEILSSIGLNPPQVSAVFVAEATITGFIAGGLGYLIGLGFYKALALLNIGLQVHQKVSAIWSIASIALAISAVLTGAFAALKNSVAITPSLMRRWKIDRSSGGFMDPWTVNVPVKLEKEDIGLYLDYIESRLIRYKDNPVQITSGVKRHMDDDCISFIFKSFQTSTGNFYTRNELRVIPAGDEYTAVLESMGNPEWVHVVGSLIRRITMDYTNERS
jgi:hypothetical protein